MPTPPAPESEQASDTPTVHRTRIKFFVKLAVAVLIILLIILGSLRQVFSPINSAPDHDPIIKILKILESLEGELRHTPSFLPLSAEASTWNQTQF